MKLTKLALLVLILISTINIVHAQEPIYIRGGAFFTVSYFDMKNAVKSMEYGDSTVLLKMVKSEELFITSGPKKVYIVDNFNVDFQGVRAKIYKFKFWGVKYNYYGLETDFFPTKKEALENSSEGFKGKEK